MEVSADMAESMAPMLQSLQISSPADFTNGAKKSASNNKNSNSSQNPSPLTREVRSSLSSTDSDDTRERANEVPRKPTVTSLDPTTASASYGFVESGRGGTMHGSVDTKSAESSVSGSASSLQDQDGVNEETGLVLDPDEIQTPIMGFETLEERAKFTMFKIQVQKSDLNWMVYKRFSDFTRLNQKLEKIFPGFRFALPPKRWFRSNFEHEFLEERTLGLQAFLNNITGHIDICNSKPVKQFFCFENPPNPSDSLENSRALCETLEERLHEASVQLEQKDEQIKLLQDELQVYQRQVEILSSRLRETLSRDVQSPETSKRTSLAECDQPSPPFSPSQLPSRELSVEQCEQGVQEAPNLTSTPSAQPARRVGSPSKLGALSPIL